MTAKAIESDHELAVQKTVFIYNPFLRLSFLTLIGSFRQITEPPPPQYVLPPKKSTARFSKSTNINGLQGFLAGPAKFTRTARAVSSEN